MRRVSLTFSEPLCYLEFLQKVQREGLIWSNLNHPNILPLLGFVDDDPGFEPFGAFVSPVSRNLARGSYD
jgi:hypothetical protein